MFGSAILDIAVGLIFVYLVVSLMVTAVTELIASWRRWRANTLYLGIQNLLDAPGVREWADRLYGHPLIQSLSPLVTATGEDATSLWTRITALFNPKGGPSYIPSRTFVVALLDTVRDHARQAVLAEVGKLAPAATGAGTTAATTAGATIDRLLPGAAGAALRAELHDLLDRARTSGYTADDLQRLAGELFDRLTDQQSLDLVESRLAGTRLGRVFSALLAESERDVEKLKVNLETWFDSSMERVSGWYKRKSQWVHLLLAAALTVGINVDSIQIVQNLSRDSALRDSLVAQAQTYAKQNPPPPDANSPQNYQQLLARLNDLNLPIGWWIAPATNPANAAAVDAQHRAAEAGHRIAPFACWSDLRRQSAWGKLAQAVGFHVWGWLLTAIAVSLGAPFWFDMLNKVINLRSSGKAPEEKPKPPKEVPQPLAPGEKPAS
ncbi:MAG TPA: hypothetical protein VFE33_26400 [Thermoanaerobaculia bacterium]|nr:hypothetical protein [Thermoanaerobaculia bacterium]